MFTEKQILIFRIDTYLNDHSKCGLVETSEILNQASCYLVNASQNSDLSEEELQQELEFWTNLVAQIQLSLVDREQEAMLFAQKTKTNIKQASNKDLTSLFYLSNIYMMIWKNCKNNTQDITNIIYWKQARDFFTKEADKRDIEIACFEAETNYVNEGSENEAIKVSETRQSDAPKKSLLKRFKENPKSLSKKELEDLMDRQLDVLSSIQKELLSR